MMMTKENDDIRVNVSSGEETLEHAGKYKYLGSLVTQEGRCVEDTKTRTAIARNAFTQIYLFIYLPIHYYKIINCT